MPEHDPFADLTLEQLKLVELRFLERRSNAKKLRKLAKQHRQRAYALDHLWKQEIEELNRDLPHLQALIASREAQEAFVLPFPSRMERELRQQRTGSHKRHA